MTMENNTHRRKRSYSVLLWHRLTRTYKSNLTATGKLLKNAQLSNAQMDIISRVAEGDHLSQQELADKLLVTKGNVAQLIKKLEEMDYITRTKTGKTNVLSLTQKGQKIYEETRLILENYQEAFFGALTTEEKKELLRLLRKLSR